MTLVLAVKCRDGIVLGSDGLATMQTGGQRVGQAIGKLHAVGDRVAWGAAGTTALAQALRMMLEDERPELDVSSELAFGKQMSAYVQGVQREAVERHVAVPGSHQQEMSVVFCWCAEDGPHLARFFPSGGHPLFEEEYCAIGTGESMAHFALAAVRHFGTRDLAMADASLIVYQALDDAIGISAGTLGPPIHMVLVTQGGVHRLDEAELRGVRDGVQAWRIRQREALLGPTSDQAGDEDVGIGPEDGLQLVPEAEGRASENAGRAEPA